MKRPLRNAIAVAGSDLGSRVIGFFITVYLARVLEPAAYGLVTLGLAILGHAQLMASPGIQVVEMRNAARPGGVDPARLGGVFAVRAILAAVLFGAGMLVLILVRTEPGTAAVMAWSLLALFPLALVPDWFLQGRERMGPVGIARLAGYAAYALIAWFLVHDAGGAPMAAAAFTAGTAVTACVLWVILWKEGALPAWRADRRLWSSIVRNALPVGAAMFAGQLVMNLPPVLLAAFFGTAEAGVYGAALKLVFLVLIIDRALNALLVPALTRVRETRPDDLVRMVMLSLRVVTAVALLIVVPGVFVAGPVLDLIFGGAYAAAGPVAAILLVYVGLTLVNSVAVAVLLATGHERVYSRAMIRGSIVLALAMTLLTPFFGPAGTAAGAVIGELATVLWMLQAAGRIVPPIGPLAFVRPLVAGTLAGLAGAAASYVSGPAGMAAGALVLVVTLVLFRVVSAEEVTYLKERFV